MKPAIQFDRVSKRFTLRHEGPRSFQELVVNLFRRDGRREEMWALKDVSFIVERGETVGVVGPNGAGKSTALKLISRILEPTLGQVIVDGRVSALLELGAGFHPDLTGRENVYLNGSILGLSRREMNAKFDAIVAFSELERFIDVPVKHYSSGMYMRLGFAIAIHVDPDILLVDEVLAVGDQSFQARCLEKINELRSQGVTIFFVSHNLEAIRNLCHRAFWLDDGQVQAQGTVDRVIEHYLDSVVAAEEARLRVRACGELEHRWGSGEAEVTSVCLLGSEGRQRRVFATGETMVVRIGYRAHTRLEQPVFGLAIHREDGVQINGPNTRTSGYPIEAIEGEGSIDYIIETLPLLQGDYRLSAAIYDYTCTHPYDHHDRLYPFRVQQKEIKDSYGVVHIPSQWRLRAGPTVQRFGAAAK